MQKRTFLELNIRVIWGNMGTLNVIDMSGMRMGPLSVVGFSLGVEDKVS